MHIVKKLRNACYKLLSNRFHINNEKISENFIQCARMLVDQTTRNDCCYRVSDSKMNSTLKNNNVIFIMNFEFASFATWSHQILKLLQIHHLTCIKFDKIGPITGHPFITYTPGGGGGSNPIHSSYLRNVN